MRRRLRGILLSAVISCVLPFFKTISALAACTPAGPYNGGANIVVCAPGAGETFNTLGGNDTVTLNSGTVGTVTMGTGDDTYIQNGGTATTVNQNDGIDTAIVGGGTLGTLNQGNGADSLFQSNGTVTAINQGGSNDTMTLSGGSVGTLLQAAGDDSLTMTGGSAGTVNQAAGADSVTISSGTITSLAQGGEGDTLVLSGTGTITTVDQGAGGDFAMISGGALGSLVQGNGADDIQLSGGSITSIDQGNSADTMTMSGGTVTGSIQQGAGNDSLIITAGSVGTDVLLGAGTDTATFTAGTIGGNVRGGGNADNITLQGTIASGSIFGDAGDDILIWTSGTAPLFDGGTGSDSLAVSALEYNGAQVLNGGDDAAVVDGWTDRLTLNGLTVTSNGANLLNWEIIQVNGGQLTIADGVLTVGSDAATGLFLQSNASLEAQNALALTGNLNIAAGSTFIGTGGGAGLYSISGSLLNNGAINTTDGIVGDAVTVAGDYSGSGQFFVDASLDAIATADTLAIDGGVSGGTTSIVVNDIGDGTGSLTGTGAGNGIRIVDVSTTGNTSAGDFALSGGSISLGAFTYDLALESDGIFYLQSTVKGVAASAATTTALAEDIGLAFLGTLHERVGEQEHAGQRQLDGAAASGMWARVIAKQANETLSTSSIGDLQADSEVTGLQTGFDFYRRKSDAGSTTHLGFYGGYAWANTDVEAPASPGSSGTNNDEGWLAGLYATHYNAAGWYSDAVLQGSWLDMTVAGDGGGTISTTSTGWLASIEIGMPLAIGGHGSAFEPQAQLIYSSTHVGNTTDSSGLTYSFDDKDSLIGRAGFRLKGTKDNGDGDNGRGLVTGYIKTNLWSNLMGGDSSMMAELTPINVQGKTIWADAGLGFTVQGGKNLELFVDGGMEFGLDQQYSAFTGNAGIRFNW